MAAQVGTEKLTPGIIELSPGLFRFALFAPKKHRVSIIGPWNNWDADADRLIEFEPGLWSLERQFDEGEHIYLYDVDGVRICDPYATEMFWASGAANHDEVPQGVLQAGAPDFIWKNDGWERPHYRDLVFYETHVGDFSSEGTFRALTEKLDYLQNLGINALEIMPVWEGAINEGWGYRPIGFFACKSTYGTANDFKRLIDSAHERGIAVILDIVLSHTAKSHPFNMLYPQHDSPWYGNAIGGPNMFHMPSFDHRKPAVRAFCRQVQEHWLRQYHVDGFRYDYAINIGIDGDSGLPTLVNQVRTVMPKAYLIAEHLPEWPQIMRLTKLDGAWHVRCCYTLRVTATHEDQDEFKWHDFRRLVKRGFDLKAEGWPAASTVVNYMESHDEFRLGHYLSDMGVELENARRRIELAAWALFTAPGLPMLYHGQEFNDTSNKSVNARNPLRWELLSTDSGRHFFRFYKRLIQFRKAHSSLRSDDYDIERVMEKEKCLVYKRHSGDGDFVIFAGNFSDERHNVPVAFPARGTWEDAVTGKAHGVREDNAVINFELDGHECAVIYRK